MEGLSLTLDDSCSILQLRQEAMHRLDSCCEVCGSFFDCLELDKAKRERFEELQSCEAYWPEFRGNL